MALTEEDPSIINEYEGALISSLKYKCHSLTRFLLSVPGPGVDIVNSLTRFLLGKDITPVIVAVALDAPLDILITIAKLSRSSKEAFYRMNPSAFFGTDRNTISATIFLSWLGFEFEEEEDRNCWYSGLGEDKVRHNFTDVTLDTWRQAGCLQDAQFWAVAAADLGALKSLAAMKTEVKLDKVKLRKLAKLFNHRKIWEYLSDLQSLAWERLVETVPSAVNLSPEELMEKEVDGSVVKVLLTYRNPDFEDV